MTSQNIYTTAAFTGARLGASAGLPLSASITGFAGEGTKCSVKTMALAFTLLECACTASGAALGAGSVYLLKEVVPRAIKSPDSAIVLGSAALVSSVYQAIFTS